MKHRLWIPVGILLLFGLVACTPKTVEVERTVEVTVVQTVEVERTVVVKETVEVPVTRVVTVTPTKTPEPTATPEAEAEQGSNDFAANYVAVQDQGGVEVELIRVLCEDTETHIKRNRELGASETTLAPFEDCASSCEFILRVSNNTDGPISIHPDQGQVIINGEQIEPWDFQGTIGPPLEDTSGELHAGVTRYGGFWYGVRRSSPGEIGEITYIIDPPVNEDWDRIGQEYRFEIETAGWGFEPLPEDFP